MVIKHVWKQPFKQYGFFWWWDNQCNDYRVGCAPAYGIPSWAWKD